jgi:hypothetical protein
LDAWIDPTTGAPYTSDACTAPTVLAEGILDEAGWLYSVEAGLGALQAAPQFYVFGRNDPLFGDRRCDISGSSATCPNGDLCVCNANYLTPDQSCANAPSSAPNAWICSDPVTQRAIMPAIDRFTSDLENQSLVGQYKIETSGEFAPEAVPLALGDGIQSVISGYIDSSGPYSYSGQGPSSPGGFCDLNYGTKNYWPDAQHGPIWMLNALWFKDGGRTSYKVYSDAVMPMITAVGGVALSGPDSIALAFDPGVRWSCKDGADPSALFQLDADAIFFVRYPSINAFNLMYYSTAYGGIAHLRCDSATRALLIPCQGPAAQ